MLPGIFYFVYDRKHQSKGSCSMELGKPIAYGRTAEIYAWKEGQVLKLFHEWFPASAIEYEAQVAKAVYASGIPAPKPGELVTLAGRQGLEYERLDGTTMLHVFQKQPWRVTALARQFAELQVEMHAISTHEPNSQRKRLQDKIMEAKPLSESLKQAALQALTALPGGEQLCHGDFHPDNIMMTAKGPVVIDWIDVTSGHPLGDVARTAVLIRFGAPPPASPLGLIVRWGRSAFYNAYRQRYFELSKLNPADLEAWIPVVAAARLNEGILLEEKTLISMIQKAFTPLTGAES
jgi:uncharacterized protein (TIGR02172 family)